MLIRIVRMTFQADKTADFVQVFLDSRELIKAFVGCNHVELLQDYDDPTIFSTYSLWDSEEALNNYRKSELFGRVWKETKKLFAAPAQAFSSKPTDEAILLELSKKQ